MARHFLGRSGALALAAMLASACSTVQYTVDDGRQISEQRLERIRTFGKGQQALREAVVRSTPATASGCETDWELPIAVASSDELPGIDRVAWVRTLKVDERATVIASTADSGLDLGDRLVEIDGYRSNSGRQMVEALADRRDAGRPFEVKTASGRSVRITPIRVCRGRAQVAAPVKPDAQDYHWTYSLHPQEVFRVDLTPDEALWVVLWTQGLTAEGTGRMMGYRYGLAPLKTILGVAAFISGAGAIAAAAQGASATVASEVGSIVAKNVATGVAVNVAKQQAEDAIAGSSKNRASLEGVSWVAGTQFDKADQWGFDRMVELKADPLAAFSLHRKLAAAESVRNAFVLDSERLPALLGVAERKSLGESAKRTLDGAAQTRTAEAEEQAGGVLSEWKAEEMPQAGEQDMASADQFDRQIFESAAPMPMETLR